MVWMWTQRFLEGESCMYGAFGHIQKWLWDFYTVLTQLRPDDGGDWHMYWIFIECIFFMTCYCDPNQQRNLEVLKTRKRPQVILCNILNKTKRIKNYNPVVTNKIRLMNQLGSELGVLCLRGNHKSMDWWREISTAEAAVNTLDKY